MKYGILFFKDTENIGDDIQSYVVKKYLPHIDYVIERENLNLFRSDNDEIVNIIMNGWFLHKPYSFPPSPFINPLIISIHLTDYLRNEKPSYFTRETLDFFKKHEPIGLRDRVVKKYLDDENIDNYFSGCLTSTIKPFDNIKKTRKILLVDVSEKIEQKLTGMNKKIVLRTNKVNKEENAKLSFEERMDNVEKLLQDYQSSELVVTTRLHCAIPCLSLGVPVILIYDDNNTDIKNRLGSYLKFLNYMSENDFLKLDEINPKNFKIKNEEEFIEMSKNLDEKCLHFIKNNSKKQTVKIDLSEYYRNIILNSNNIFDYEIKKYIEHINKREKEFSKAFDDLSLLYRIEAAEKSYCVENIEKLKNEILDQAPVVNSYYKITGSRSYKMGHKVYRILRKLMFWRKK